jgi:heme/copper-type cytochrome/quinol oxidase subunit 2
MLTTQERAMQRYHSHNLPLEWYAVAFCFLILVALMGTTEAAEAKKFTLINVLFEGTKVWLPSSIIVQAGDEVELSLINNLDEPHGFRIAEFGVEEVVQPKGKSTVKLTPTTVGVYSFICHLHPPHIGGQLLVLGK